MMWPDLAFALTWLCVHSLQMLSALMAISLRLRVGKEVCRQRQNHCFMPELTKAKSAISAPSECGFTNSALLLMVVYHFWTSDCPDGGAGNMGNPYKLTA